MKMKEKEINKIEKPILKGKDLINFKEFKQQFKIKSYKFEVSGFEELMLNDIYEHDEQTKIKLNRNVTSMLNEEIDLYYRQKRNIRYTIKGETRCHSKGTKILMGDYSLKNIEDIKIGESIISYNNYLKKYENKKVKKLFRNGVSKTLKLKLRGNKIINSTDSHKFYVLNKGWTELKNIKKSDYVATLDNININDINSNYSNDFIKLLGFYLGDGYSKNNNSKNSRVIQFDLKKIDKINYLNKLVKNTNCKITQNKTKFTFAKKNKLFNNRIKDDFTKFIYSLNLIKCRAKTKFIPTEIKRLHNNFLLNLLGGLISSDGYVDKKKGFVYTTISKSLKNDIEFILRKLSINYKIYIKYPKKINHNISYHIFISSIKDIKLIYFNCDLRKELKIKIENNYNFKIKPNKHFIIKNNLKFVKVNSIEKNNLSETFDLNIEHNNNYFANYILSHNSGKSYVGIKIMEIILSKNDIDFNAKADYYVCGNQIEYRQKLKKARFGEFYLVDENFFTRAGLGANIEISQLQDYNNIIAKMNIGSIFITPEKFLNVGAVLGFATYGRDSKNWLSRLLLFKFKDGFPYLIGYVIIDIGGLYRKYGCYLYKLIGGCTNPKRKELKELNKDNIKYSWCIPEQYKTNITKLKKHIERNEDGIIQNCPFYKICGHGMAKYEKKKDSWIIKEMKGGLDERTHERFRLSCELILDLNPNIVFESNVLKLRAKNGKDLKNRVKLKVHKYTNTKMGIGEFDELIEMIKSNTDISFLCDTLAQLEKEEDLQKRFFELEGGEIIKSQFKEVLEKNKKIKQK